MSREWIPSPQVVRQLWPFLATFCLIGLVTFPTIEGIVSRWLKLDESYSHGFLLAAVSLFLTARAAMIHPVKAGFYPFWLVPFIACFTVYWLGGLIRLQALQQLVMVPMLLSAFAVLMGWRQVRWFLVPLGLLFLTVPVWDFLSWTLQLITVAVNQFLLGFANIEFEVEGVFVYLIGVGTFEVAHGCSGLRYLLVGQALVLIYGETYLSRLRSRVTLFCLGVAFALVANWIRVFVIIYLGYETNMQSSLIDDHDNFGWWVFAGTLVPLYFIARRLEIKDDLAIAQQKAVQPEIMTPSGNPAVAVVVIMIAGFATWIALPERTSAVSAQPAALALDLSEHYGPVFGAQLAGWRPQIRNPDRMYVQTLFDREEVRAGQGAEVTYYFGVFTYEFQRHRAELIQYSNRLYDREVWTPEHFFHVPTSLDIPVQGITLRNRMTGQRIHLGYTYLVQGRWETDQWRAKLAQVSGFFNHRDDASLLITAVNCENCNVEEALTGFIERAFPEALARIDLEVVRPVR
ncbi:MULTISPECIES: exosortase [Marinobacter]|jgi:exosortase|uniref:Methanolan biosynthesis EpsI domain-containing protein n=3 Tax=Marinobacter TaxID=2742 RepID=A0A455W9U8_MARNT|nr:exosortase [Marinobacter excellens]KXO11779.1 Eight transmembrane protein EpsH / EpsI protein [Marinobacter excellens LAMA 842]BBJ03867.1 hypothetical protein YBY_17160 [Marinobacter nauticus]